MRKIATEQGKRGRFLLSLVEIDGRTCLACRLGRRWTVATGDQRPSTRGFGVDVGTAHREQERADVTQFSPQVGKGVVLVWCYGDFSQAKKGGKSPEKQEIH